ncbi:MAG TPA: DUF4956 domain-containing protein [candidate division Zixibacteria bacterium]|nr:DUF4956 domain-containing protein [candidate division Zixibacteria bacterium]
MDQALNFLSSDAPLSIPNLILNLSIGIVLSLILRWHFQRFGSTLSNRSEFNLVFPFVLLTTVLIITVVKSSLALSLGLVGALSIVRFRTPIKEPEELAYLFIAIAMGLGLGANQTLPTIVAGLMILGVMAVLGTYRNQQDGKHIYLSLDWQLEEDAENDHKLDQLNDVIDQHTTTSDLRRFDARDQSFEATYVLDLENGQSLTTLTSALQQMFPSIGITFLDQNQMPRV